MPQLQRQSLGCGYEPPLPEGAVRLATWKPSTAMFRGAEPTTCAGYSVRLPEVVEAQKARVHWSTGNLARAIGDGEIEELLDLITIVEGASNDVQRWALTPSADGGGGK